MKKKQFYVALLNVSPETCDRVFALARIKEKTTKKYLHSIESADEVINRILDYYERYG